MLKARIIPCLLLKESSLVKTINFSKYNYIGDPINTCRIFNELEVDELSFMDISATVDGKEPDYKLLQEIAEECFMPLSYGGGIKTAKQAEKILNIGFEKIILNSSAYRNKNLIKEIVNHTGSQSLIISIDYKKNIFGKYSVYSSSGKVNEKKHPLDWAKEIESAGAGEILLTSIDREGTYMGYDIEVTKQITSNISIPVIANGGAGKIDDIADVIKIGGASAAALGSMVVYQAKDMGVLVNFPDRKKLEEII